MRSHWYVSIIIICLFSCGNKTNNITPTSDLEEGWGERYQKELDDSLAREKVLNDEPAKNAVVNPTSVSSSSGSSGVHRSSDNMRGFDPASEDDMHDNGMRRYMENNDDEGWD